MTDNREIREGAGLTEARLNQDFIEFLRKWSTPVLVVVALAAVSYAGYTRWNERKIQQYNDAYSEFERVAGVASPSPESLKRVAEDFEGIGSVSLMARLQAADVYLQSIRRGIKPGAQVEPMVP
jgi:predicted negative regulator of RcsB-dependent stress response